MVGRISKCLFALVLIASLRAHANPPETITVFAAASLTDALTAATDAYRKASGAAVLLSFGASSALARQIESGAKADVFFSADTDWIDYLQARSLLDSKSRQSILGNRLVLIAPASSQISLHIAPKFPLAAALGRERLVTGDPDFVPVGRYARDALMNLEVWSQVADRIVRADNVRVALAYVARGEAALGIVYKTDALIERKVRIVDTFPADSHPPIVYPIALTKTATPAAKDYIAFLSGNDAAEIFKKYGFTTEPAR